MRKFGNCYLKLVRHSQRKRPCVVDGKIESDNQTINQIFLCYFLLNRFLLIMWYFLVCRLGNILNRNHTSNVRSDGRAGKETLFSDFTRSLHMYKERKKNMYIQ